MNQHQFWGKRRFLKRCSGDFPMPISKVWNFWADRSSKPSLAISYYNLSVRWNRCSLKKLHVCRLRLDPRLFSDPTHLLPSLFPYQWPSSRPGRHAGHANTLCGSTDLYEVCEIPGLVAFWAPYTHVSFGSLSNMQTRSGKCRHSDKLDIAPDHPHFISSKSGYRHRYSSPLALQTSVRCILRLPPGSQFKQLWLSSHRALACEMPNSLLLCHSPISYFQSTGVLCRGE